METRNHRFIQKRKELGLTQVALADRVGLSQSMIAHIEAGTKEPSKKYKIAFARLFGVSVEWLFYEQVIDQHSAGEIKDLQGGSYTDVVSAEGGLPTYSKS